VVATQRVSYIVVFDSYCDAVVHVVMPLVWLLLLLMQAKPSVHFVKKYGRPKSINIMPVNSIRMFGRQLLETLRFLHDRGYPYGQHRVMIIA